MFEETMTNNEVVDTTEQMLGTNSGKFIGIAAGVGLAALAGFMVYRYVAKPIIAKMKEGKQSQQEPIDVSAEEVVVEENKSK